MESDRKKSVVAGPRAVLLAAAVMLAIYGFVVLFCLR